jgi:hypothetical protein
MPENFMEQIPFEKLIVAHLANKLPAFYGTGMFIDVSKRVPCCTLSCFR